MNRDALLLYLKDLRDLEIAKRKIETIYDYEKANYEKNINELSIKNFYNVPNKKSGWSVGKVLGMLFFLLIGGFGTFFFIHRMVFGTKEVAVDGGTTIINGQTAHIIDFEKIPIGITVGGVIMTIIMIIFLLIGIFLVWDTIQETKNIKKDIEETEKHNENEVLRVENNNKKSQQLQQQWIQRKKYLNAEYDKVNDLLESDYSINVLANQYRNLASLYYIYDYMSSSQESLKDTLIHEHMESGIQRILEKLDYIIDQNQQIIFQNRILEAQNNKTIEQNKRMLKSLQQTEINTSIAAQYAQISANYSEINAYFSLANYLKR